MRHTQSPQLKKEKGFSLVEVVIAIGIVAVLLTSFIAIFGPAQQNVVRALGVGDVNRLTSTLENELSYLRKSEKGASTSLQSGQYTSGFDKAFAWLQASGTQSSSIVVYQYHADPAQKNADGTLAAKTSAEKSTVPGVDYITQTVARNLGSSSAQNYITAELSPGVVEGGVYAVRLTQLVSNATTGALTTGTAGQVVDSQGSSVADSASYPEGYIAMQAEFFRLPNNLAGYVTGNGWDFENLGAPIVTQNIAVRK